MPFISVLLGVFAFFVSAAHADENGKVVVQPVNCQSSVFSSIQKVCSLVDKVGASCKITADGCLQGSQEIFTGNLIEFASNNNIKAWNGMGGMGDPYAKATTCLLRDLADLPEQKIKTSASASTLFGDVHANQEVGFLSFDKATATFTGYNRLQACGPVVGCLDAYTQSFKLTPVSSNKKGSGFMAGQYEIQNAYALDLWSEGQAQGIQVTLPGLTVVTPYGTVSASPEFRFSRTTGLNGAPFDGNFKSSFPDTGLGITSNRMVDVYGRNPGTAATALSPMDPTPGSTPTYHPKGWISQLALGNRDPDLTVPAWKAPAGVEFPTRPDGDFHVARSNAEKVPNAYLGASIKVSYKPLGLIPPEILSVGCGGPIVKLCLKELEVYAKPNLDVGFSSQVNFFEAEQMKWNGAILPDPSLLPIPDFRPWNLDQAKGVSIQADSAAASLFSLDAGLNFVIHLSIDTFFTSFDDDLINIHPETQILSKVDKGFSSAVTAGARSQASKVLTDKKLFQQYYTLKGKNEAAAPGVDGGTMHIQACLAKATPPGKLPPEPTYTPGNPTVLLDQIEYPCNICMFWNPIPYVDNNKQAQTVPGMKKQLFPVSEAAKPADVQWSCINKFQNGCYDMCKMDKVTGKLTLDKTALELIAAGQGNKMPKTCKRF